MDRISPMNMSTEHRREKEEDGLVGFNDQSESFLVLGKRNHEPHTCFSYFRLKTETFKSTKMAIFRKKKGKFKEPAMAKFDK